MAAERNVAGTSDTTFGVHWEAQISVIRTHVPERNLRSARRTEALICPPSRPKRLHGALGRIEIWAEPMEALSATRRVIAYDLRGHGNSSPPAFLTHISTRAVGACSVPITYLLGDDSIPLFRRAHKTLVEALPSIRTIRVPGATHMLPFQAPQTIVEAVLARHGAD